MRTCLVAKNSLFRVQRAFFALQFVRLPLPQPLFLQFLALLVALQLLQLVLNQRICVLGKRCIGQDD